MKELINRDTLNYLILLTYAHLSTRLLSAVQYNGPEYRSSDWKYGNASKTLFGLDYYMTTRNYREHPFDEPTVCFNAYDLKDGKYGYFICPLRLDHHLATNCCGDRNKQQCCRPGTDQKTSSIVLWLVLGGFAAIFVLAGLRVLWGLVSDGCCQQTFRECCGPTVDWCRDLCIPCTNGIARIGKCCRRKNNTRDAEINELEAGHTKETTMDKRQTETGDTHEIEPLNL